MQFIALIISALAATAFAYPTNDQPATGFVACANNGVLFSAPNCCATDVLGLANLDCTTPPKVPTSPSDFQAVCAAIGKRPRCCVAPLLGQALLCQAPIGTN
jgi:hypothetical protein